ncbi:MAG: ABC transporter substrate-binding protein [Bacteroidales bacterium]
MRLQKLLFQTTFIIVFPGLIGQNTKAIQNSAVTDKTVKIGLLIRDKNSLSAMQGAEMAIKRANKKGGYNGKPFQLEVRSMEGPWGAGAKEAVDLIFKENVCALIGACDGRNSHLVEQVTTKARIVFLSVWASDPTLSQAFVPWYFTCVPTDLQQADVLIDEIYNNRKIVRIATVADSDYDSKMALESFVKRAASAGKNDSLQVYYDNKSQDFNNLIDKIVNANVGGIILFGKPHASMKLIDQMKQSKINQPLFATLSLMDEDEFSDQGMKNYENIVAVSSGNTSKSKCSAFLSEYQKTYGSLPGAVASYSFDGMSLLIEAIRMAGTDRENIRKYMAGMHFEGVTGPIQFDEKGKRIGKVNLMEIKNGLLVDIEIK